MTGALISTALNLADRFPAQVLMASSAAFAALCTFSLAVLANGLPLALVLRFLTGCSWPASTRWASSYGVLGEQQPPRA